jgi:hypothetical protein
MKKTSVIMCAFDTEMWQRHITLAALNCIRRFTPSDEYELILVDTGTVTDEGGPYNRFEIIKPDKWIKRDDIGYSAAMNLGVKESDSESEYVILMHNDVFVQEGWLPKLRKYLEENLCEVVYPDQIARTRKNMEEIYEGKAPVGYDEAGMQMMKKKDYIRIGGYDDDFKSVYQDLAFIKRKNAYSIRTICTTDTFITHIGSVTYAKDAKIENKLRGEEGALLDKKY